MMVGLVAAIVMLIGGLARWTGMTSRRQDLALLIGAVVLLVVVFAGLILCGFPTLATRCPTPLLPATRPCAAIVAYGPHFATAGSLPW
jgi:hypothetical protein